MELYIHIPFCVKKCDYCDFLSAPGTGEAQTAYVRALFREMEAVKEECHQPITSVFIGGGTPSILDEMLMGELLEKMNACFPIQPDAEITIEANPGTLSAEKLEVYRKGGVNRLSIGLQSPKDEELKSLGRIHTYREFLESYDLARKTGFSNINVDLMFAIPDQTCEGWTENLKTVAELEPEHISAYSLIVEEGTPFARRKLNLPDEDAEYRMYEDTAAILEQFEYRQYEISNYAREGFACQHNTGYWRRDHYLGLGLGASSFCGRTRFSNTENMEKYLEKSGNPEQIRENAEELSREDAMAEFMFLGLRMTDGISGEEFEKCFGVPMDSVYGKILEKYKRLSLLQEKDDRIFFTRKGIHVSNVVMADFLL